MSKWLFCLMAAYLGHMPPAAPKMSIRWKAITITHVFEEIHRQTGYSILFTQSIDDAPTVDLNLHNATVEEVLDACLAGLELGYTINGKKITVFRKVALGANLYKPINGTVWDSDGKPLEGATISIGGMAQTNTHANGSFTLPVRAFQTIYTVSYAGYSTMLVKGRNNLPIRIYLQPNVGVLDQAIVQAYGKTTKRFVTGSVSTANAAELGSQPAGNVLEALEGRVPGMFIRQPNGVPGSAFDVLIRGRRSIAQGTDPLIVIDGVPVVNNDRYLSTIGSGSAQGQMGASVLNAIPASAIASVVVLKDASATAIYGSRGANGVILLTLKTDTTMGLHWGVDLFSGHEKTVRTSPLLNTTQYLALREEAVRNDGVKVDSFSVPELAWGNSYTNFKKEVIGNTGLRQNARIDLSGGDSNTLFLLSGNYYNQTSIFPGSTGDDRISIYGQLHHQAFKRRLKLDLSVLYSWEKNFLPMADYTQAMYLAPNAPPFRDAAGHLQWSSDGLSYLNIPALGYNSYHASVSNQFDHLQVSYDLLHGLVLRSSLGYYGIGSDERSQILIAGQDPAGSPTGQTNYAGNTGHSVLLEQLAEYSHCVGPGRIEALIGLTWQQQKTESSSQTAAGYTSDLLLASGGGNPVTSSTANADVYRYEALFGRLNYILHNRYILTLSGRRDGSSRFGPGKQFGNFWAVSGAWVFSDEHWLRTPSWLSFGKLRGSLGTTGNDQIGDNLYSQLFTGTNSARSYQGLQGVVPNSLPNDNLRWEVNYSSELALDLGFLHNRLLLSATGYRDWTSNQLLYRTLPSQSGLPGVYDNVPADVLNEGLEFSLEAVIRATPHFRWAATATLTVPVNRLKRFASLGSTYYSQSLVVGKSLSVLKGYHFEGVNPDSGLFMFRGLQPDGSIDPGAVVNGGNLDAHYYGGCSQSFRYKSVQLDLFFEFRGQSGYNPLVVLYQEYPPGFPGASMLGSGPTAWLRRWQRTGDRASIQQLTESYGSVAYQRMDYYIGSDAQSIDASFIRWKGLALSWRLPASWMSRMSMRDGQVYIKGQNLLTYTHFPVTDPESQNPTGLPLIRSLVIGFRLNM